MSQPGTNADSSPDTPLTSTVPTGKRHMGEEPPSRRSRLSIIGARAGSRAIRRAPEAGSRRDPQFPGFRNPGVEATSASGGAAAAPSYYACTYGVGQTGFFTAETPEATEEARREPEFTLRTKGRFWRSHTGVAQTRQHETGEGSFERVVPRANGRRPVGIAARVSWLGQPVRLFDCPSRATDRRLRRRWRLWARRADPA
jgi:hypothetical protein